MISVSDNESVNTNSLSVVVPNHAISITSQKDFLLNVKKSPQVFEKSNLQRIVLTVILDMSLMVLEIFHNVLLLSKL